MTDLIEGKNIKNQGKYRMVMEFLNEEKNKNQREIEAENEIKNQVKEHPAWDSAKDFFIHNGTETPTNRTPSPDKITTPKKGNF